VTKPQRLIAFRHLIARQPLLVVNTETMMAGIIDSRDVSDVDITKVHDTKVECIDTRIVETGIIGAG
jgi:hypothetical protein